MKVGNCEYLMNKKMATELLKLKKGNQNNQDYLVDYVNEQCGLLRKCTKVTIVDD